MARDVELMVFLKPTVTQTLADVEKLMQDEQVKAPQIRRWEAEMKQRKEEEKKAEEEEAAQKEKAEATGSKR